VSAPGSEQARVYRDIASKVWERLQQERGASEAAVPQIVFE
jgi:ATP-binding protein involved in chromosome partitioning